MIEDFIEKLNSLELKIKGLEDRINELVRHNHDSLILMAPNAIFEAIGPEPIQVDAGWQPMRNQPCQQISRTVGNCRSIWADHNRTNCFLIPLEILLIGLIDSGESSAGLGSMGNTFGNKWVITGTPDYLTPIELLCHEKSRDDILYSISNPREITGIRVSNLGSIRVDESYNEFTNDVKYSNRNMVKPDLTMPGCMGCTLGAPGFSQSRSSPDWLNTHDCLLNRAALRNENIETPKVSLNTSLINQLIQNKEFLEAITKLIQNQPPKPLDDNALLDLDQVRTYLNVSPGTVKSLIREDKLSTFKVGNQHRVLFSDLKLQLRLGKL